MLLLQDEIKELESYLGFLIIRVELTPKSKTLWDEGFSYKLCQRFYNNKEELEIAIKKTTNILLNLPISKRDPKIIAVFYSLLGNMYYLLEDFNKSIGCFMKSLNYNKNDLSSWIELAFSLRSLEEFDLFEKIIFNLDNIFYSWKQDSSSKLTKEKILELVSK